jgi:hypothetical protein
MKLYNLIRESNDSNVTYTELTPVDRKFLQFMWKKGISQNNDLLIHKFLKDTLAINDLETQVRLINLYMLNAPNADTEKGFLDMDKVVELDTNSSNDYTKVLSEFKGIPETFVVEVYEGDLRNPVDTYLPEYRIFDVARGQYESYIIARDHGEAWIAAETHVSNMIDEEGYESFNQQWLVDYLNPDEVEIESYLEQHLEERARDSDEEDLRDELFLYRPEEGDEYENAVGDIEILKDTIKDLTLDIQEKEFDKDNIESDMIVIDRDMDGIDMYKDDDFVDSEYQPEINRLQIRYDELNEMLEEVSTYLNECYKEIDKSQEELKEYKEIIDKYSGESLIELFIEEVKADKLYEAMNDVGDFLDRIGMEIDEAYYQYGYVDLDKDEIVAAAVREDGLGQWLASYDGYENEETITQEDGNYSDPFYLFRTN